MNQYQYQYLKFAAQVAATVLAGVAAALIGDDVVDTGEIFNIIVLGFGALSVLGAGNLPAGAWAYTKTYVAAGATAAAFLASAYTGGITSAEWTQLAIAVLGTAGVYGLPGPKVLPRHAAL